MPNFRKKLDINPEKTRLFAFMLTCRSYFPNAHVIKKKHHPKVMLVRLLSHF